MAASGRVIPGTGVPADFEAYDCFLVRQHVEHFEAMTGFETENTYV